MRGLPSSVEFLHSSVVGERGVLLGSGQVPGCLDGGPWWTAALPVSGKVLPEDPFYKLRKLPSVLEPHNLPEAR